MTIQEYSKLIALVAKVETKKQAYAEINKELNEVNVEDEADKWLEIYDRYKKAQNSLKEAYREFRKKMETEEYKYLAHVPYSFDKSDRHFYWQVRYAVRDEAKHIQFTTGE